MIVNPNVKMWNMHVQQWLFQWMNSDGSLGGLVDDESIIDESTVIGCSAIVSRSNVMRSTISGSSIVDKSNVINSTITSSDVYLSSVIDSTIDNSIVKTDSTIYQSVIQDDCYIANSTISTRTTIKKCCSVYQSTINNCELSDGSQSNISVLGNLAVEQTRFDSAQIKAVGLNEKSTIRNMGRITTYGLAIEVNTGVVFDEHNQFIIHHVAIDNGLVCVVYTTKPADYAYTVNDYVVTKTVRKFLDQSSLSTLEKSIILELGKQFNLVD